MFAGLSSRAVEPGGSTDLVRRAMSDEEQDGRSERASGPLGSMYGSYASPISRVWVLDPSKSASFFEHSPANQHKSARLLMFKCWKGKDFHNQYKIM